MNRIKVLTMFLTFLFSSLNSYSWDFENDWKIEKRLYTIRRIFKPTNVNDKLIDLYKKYYNLNKATLPFNSFVSFYPKHNKSSFENILILHTENCIGCNVSTPISMISSDKKCIAYIQMQSQYGDGWLKNNISDIEEALAREVRCNKDDLRYWQGEIQEKEIKHIFDENIIVYRNDVITNKCNADALFLCKFPCRERVGIINNESVFTEIHPEYPHYFTFIIYKDKSIPIKMNLFLTDKGYKNIDRYISDICNSLAFNNK